MLVAIHPLHQQKAERHVQMTALVSSTGVSQDRRTWRMISLTCVMRPFQVEAKEELASKIRAEEKRLAEEKRDKYTKK